MLNKTITIQSIEIKADGRKYALKDENGDKFGFWKTKKDGTATKAYDFFVKNSVSIGSKMEIGYKSEQKEYEGHPYEERTILAFKLPTGNAPQSPRINQEPRSYNQPIQPQTPHQKPNLHSHDDLVREINNNIQKIVRKIQEIEKDTEGLKMTLINEENEKSFEFHKNTIGIVPSKISEVKKTEDGFINEQGIEIKDVPF